MHTVTRDAPDPGYADPAGSGPKPDPQNLDPAGSIMFRFCIALLTYVNIELC